MQGLAVEFGAHEAMPGCNIPSDICGCRHFIRARVEQHLNLRKYADGAHARVGIQTCVDRFCCPRL